MKHSPEEYILEFIDVFGSNYIRVCETVTIYDMKFYYYIDEYNNKWICNRSKNKYFQTLMFENVILKEIFLPYIFANNKKTKISFKNCIFPAFYDNDYEKCNMFDVEIINCEMFL